MVEQPEFVDTAQLTPPQKYLEKSRRQKTTDTTILKGMAYFEFSCICVFSQIL